MSNVSICVRMDESLKDNFEKTCKSIGISMTAAFNLFASVVVYEQRIPFELKAKPINADEIWYNLEQARKRVNEKYPNGMTLEEINALIDEVRSEHD